MKPFSTLVVLLSLAVISLQGSCVRDEPKPLILNDSTFLSYWFFPVGSYWIYKDSAGTELDTFTMARSYFREQLGTYDEVNWQFHVIEVVNCGVGKTQVGRPRPYDRNSYYYALDQRWQYGSATRFFWIKDKVLDNLENQLFYTGVDSLQINGRWYKDVVYMRNKDTQSFNDSVRREYYAKNIGIIKRSYASGRVWELQEYYIAP